MKVQVITYDDDVFTTELKNKSDLMQAIESQRFIEVEGTVINTSFIKMVKEKKTQNTFPVYLANDIN